MPNLTAIPVQQKKTRSKQYRLEHGVNNESDTAFTTDTEYRYIVVTYGYRDGRVEINADSHWSRGQVFPYS